KQGAVQVEGKPSRFLRLIDGAAGAGSVGNRSGWHVVADDLATIQVNNCTVIPLQAENGVGNSVAERNHERFAEVVSHYRLSPQNSCFTVSAEAQSSDSGRPITIVIEQTSPR